jgi:hypothetical protein
VSGTKAKRVATDSSLRLRMTVGTDGRLCEAVLRHRTVKQGEQDNDGEPNYDP